METRKEKIEYTKPISFRVPAKLYYRLLVEVQKTGLSMTDYFNLLFIGAEGEIIDELIVNVSNTLKVHETPKYTTVTDKLKEIEIPENTNVTERLVMPEFSYSGFGRKRKVEELQKEWIKLNPQFLVENPNWEMENSDIE
jgi:thiamine pyrophosphokinase